MRRSLRIAIMALILQCSILSAGTSGKIAGQVIDGETGEPLIGVNIIVEGTSHGAATNADGYYTILNMMPGTYSVKASMIGYQAVVQQNVQVMIDLTTPLDFELTTEVLADRKSS